MRAASRLQATQLGWALVALTLALASPARADEASDAAMLADEVNQEQCANLYSGQVGRAAASTVAVGDAWGKVNTAYEQTGAPYLLYWRGALAQCLGRDEAAAADLTEFVESQGDSASFASLVK